MGRTPRERRFSVLHLILAITPTNGQYNEHCLPLVGERDIAICTYFTTSGMTPAPGIRVFEGDGTVRGFFRALRAALGAQTYDVIHVHTPHAAVLLLAGLWLSGSYRRLKGSIVHTVQNSFQNFKRRNQLLFIPAFAGFTRTVFCGHAALDSFPWYMKRLAAGRTDVVQNAMDLDRIDRQLRSVARRPVDDPFEVVSVGLIDMKNPLTVLSAFRQADDGSSRLVMLGEGYLRNRVTADIHTAGLSQRVTLTGMVPRDSALQHFARADLFVSASRGEGLPVAVLEAMACGCPVVLADIPPHREIAADADFIPLVDTNDAPGLAREIRRFREMPPHERVAIGRRCRTHIEERFSLAAMHAGYAEVYARVSGVRPDVSPKAA